MQHLCRRGGNRDRGGGGFAGPEDCVGVWDWDWVAGDAGGDCDVFACEGVFQWSTFIGILLGGLGLGLGVRKGRCCLYVYFYCDVRKEMVLGGVMRLDVMLELFLLCEYLL